MLSCITSYILFVMSGSLAGLFEVSQEKNKSCQMSTSISTTRNTSRRQAFFSREERNERRKLL